MIRLYDGFDLGSPDFSASMTISGPAPIIMAMYNRRGEAAVWPGRCSKTGGTVQADIFKESRRKNETIFSDRAVAAILPTWWNHQPRNAGWYPISISVITSARPVDTGAAGCLHTVERLCLRGHVRGRRDSGRSIRSAALVLLGLRV